DTWSHGLTAETVAAPGVGSGLARSLGRSAGRGEQGGRTAIPMWIEFMREALAGVPDVEPPRPPGIVEARVNPKTGELASDLNCNAELELFEAGRLPRRESDRAFGLDGGCGRSVEEPLLTEDGQSTEQRPSTSGSGRSSQIF